MHINQKMGAGRDLSAKPKVFFMARSGFEFWGNLLDIDHISFKMEYRNRFTRSPRNDEMAALACDRANLEHDAAVARAQSVVCRLNDNMRKENTKLAYDPKIKEFHEYCSTVHGRLGAHEIYLVTNAKVYDFLCYVAFRSKRKCGKRKHGAQSSSAFNYEEYKDIKEKYFGASIASSESIPDLPTNACAFQLFNTYSSAIRNLHKEQQASQSTSLVWEQIWQSNCQNLLHHVKFRKKVMARENYEEKMDNQSTFFRAHDTDKAIEEAMWEKGRNACNLRSAFPHNR